MIADVMQFVTKCNLSADVFDEKKFVTSMSGASKVYAAKQKEIDNLSGQVSALFESTGETFVEVLPE